MNKSKKSTLKKLMRYIGKYKLLMLLSAVLAVGIVFLTLYIPILIGDAIDLIIGKDNVDLDGIYGILLTAGIMIVSTAFLQWIMSSINNRIAYNITRDMRKNAFSKIEVLPLSYVDSHKTGDLLNRVVTDTDQVAEGLLLGFTQLFTGILTIIGTLIFMLVLDYKIALVVVLLTPISLFIARFIGKHTHDMFVLRSKTSAEQTAHIDEVISNQKLVSAFSQEDEMTEQFDEINGRLEKSSLRAIFYSSLVNPTTRFVNSLVYAGVALVGALTAIATAGASTPFTIGKLTCLLSYTNQYTKPFNEISGVITEFQNALASAGRVFELIEADSEPKEAPDAIELSLADGNVDMNNVSFSYTEDRPLIENLNLKIKHGMRVAIVGPTGCGKTTLINLLMRFYDVNEGEISLDGVNIKSLTRHSLRSNYGMVLQETWLKAGTIKENIALGKPDATDEEIIAAAKAAHSHSFIKRLPNGYDTVIGDNDGSLSQGQRQLLCITRVMLALPPMLILDEATSSIDTRTEIRIQKAFAKLCEGRTSFIVAHRLSTIMESDIILVMKDGSVIEQGTHRELLKLRGFYYELYNSHFAKTN